MNESERFHHRERFYNGNFSFRNLRNRLQSLSPSDVANLRAQENSTRRRRRRRSGHGHSRNFHSQRTSSSKHRSVRFFVLLFFRSEIVESILSSRLRDVILTDARLYLIFEYLSMDLKKYFDCLGEGEDMESGLIKVRRTLLNVFSPLLTFRATCIKSSTRFSSVIVVG